MASARLLANKPSESPNSDGGRCCSRDQRRHQFIPGCLPHGMPQATALGQGIHPGLAAEVGQGHDQGPFGRPGGAGRQAGIEARSLAGQGFDDLVRLGSPTVGTARLGEQNLALGTEHEG